MMKNLIKIFMMLKICNFWKNKYDIDNKDGGFPEYFGFKFVKDKINNEILATVFRNTKFKPNDWGMFNCNPIYYNSYFYRIVYE